MAAKHQAPKGTFDVLPADEAARAPVSGAARERLRAAGYARIETPIFEDTGLFERGVGESTDIVRKEMFTFDDQGGRSVTLRPEGTAPIWLNWRKRPAWGRSWRKYGPRYQSFTGCGSLCMPCSR